MDLKAKWMKLPVGRVAPNTFIGTSNLYLTDKVRLLSRLDGLTLNDVKNFQVDGTNISCFISKNYITKPGFGVTASKTYPGGNSLKYFIDPTGKITEISNHAFYRQNMNHFLAPAVEIILGQALRGHATQGYMKEQNLYFPKTTTITGDNQAFGNLLAAKRIYLPKCQDYNNSLTYSETFNAIRTGAKIYVHPNMMTVNGGELQADLAYVRDIRSGSIIPVTDFTPPESITDLDVQLYQGIDSDETVFTFTPPSSINGIDFYELWFHEIGSNDPIRLYLPYITELTASGQSFKLNLKPDTPYVFKIAAVDSMYNGTGLSDTPAFSNEINLRTL